MLLNFAIVEDVAVDAQALCRALRSASAGRCELSLRFFESGDALLQSPAPAEYDAVFLDILMPGTNGVETAQRLRELSPRLPLIFITSSGDYIWQALPVHPFDYLLKPYTDDAIAKLLGDLLRAMQHVEREIEVRCERKKLPRPPARQKAQVRRLHSIPVPPHAERSLSAGGNRDGSGAFPALSARSCRPIPRCGALFRACAGVPALAAADASARRRRAHGAHRR